MKKSEDKLHSLLFATNNPHKLQEVQLILEGWHIQSLAECHISCEIPETGQTLEANAIEKATFIRDHYHLDCFAEDTGLEVEALDGAPGVYTARYAGALADATSNMLKLLHALEGARNRKARFRTVLALCLEGEVHLFEGIVDGTIAMQASGKGGFGYDPIFIPDGYKKTFAELPPEVKKAISHRARAVAKLTAFLQP
jgi:XTP/dITP diphosphohydrolase